MPSVQAAGTAMLVPLAPYPTPVPFTPPNGAQSQLVCSGCRNLLMYPAGATSICCAVCGTVTAVPAPGMHIIHSEQKSSCNVHENKERLKGNTNGFRAPQRCARRVDGACTQVAREVHTEVALVIFTLLCVTLPGLLFSLG
nr:protein LOL1 isoform X1 [Oryza sativa Japonica Group]